jgi:hypothetical protein
MGQESEQEVTINKTVLPLGSHEMSHHYSSQSVSSILPFLYTAPFSAAFAYAICACADK